MNRKLAQRYAELEDQLAAIAASLHTVHSEFTGTTQQVDSELLSEWIVKASNLLTKSCGAESEHFKAFIRAEKVVSFDTTFSLYKRVKSVFRAAKEDFEGGYLASVKSLVQAEVFDNELDQARELLSSGYQVASAVIAGVVLETGLRELCDRHSIAHGPIDKMNAELAKLGIYTKLQQKRITALADIRNSAAHGKPDQFNADDVKMMLRDVEHFLSQYLQD